MTIRSVGIVMEPKEADEAKGVTIRRTIGSERLVLLDPFLLLDHLTVSAVEGEMQSVGFPRHPHRGIETLTYVFAGRVHHRDSLGNDSNVGAHGSQWMTAGGGIFHEEMLEAGGEGEEARFIFVSARPLHEPVLQYRSLVMNTVEEMRQAIDDLKNGTFEGR